MRYKAFFWVFSFFGLLASCSVGPPYTPPSVEVPSAWKNKKASCEEYEATKAGDLVYLDFWWQVFDDEKLNELEETAIESNRNLLAAYERIKEYRAMMGIAAADFYPQLTLNPAYSCTSELLKNYSNISQLVTNNFNVKNIFRANELLYFLPLNLSYEVDLWGKIEDQYVYAKYNWLAEQKDYQSIMLTLTTDLATAYYQLRAADAQIDLLAKVLKTREKAAQINHDRYDAKIIFYADVALAEEEVGSALIQYTEVVRQRNVLEDQIAVLIGVPASEFTLEHLPLEGQPPCIPAGMPSEVLMRRPDIAESAYTTLADHAMVKQAYSQFFPSLTLTSAAGFESPVLKDFLKWISRYFFDGFSISQLVFDGFKTSNNLSLQLARFGEASRDYQQLVLTAFQEVEDSITNVEAYAKEYELIKTTTQWAQKAYDLYYDRYKWGLINYIDVVNTERDLLNFQIQQNSVQGYKFVATIQLIKALGGGWSDDVILPEAGVTLTEEATDSEEACP